MTKKSYFAVQAQAKWEDVREVAQHVLRQAKASNLSFDSLEYLDTFTLGTSRFIRFRADLVNPFPMLDALLKSGRGVIVPNDIYQARFPNGRVGPVPHATMQCVARTPQTFKGTANPHWERQFPTPNP